MAFINAKTRRRKDFNSEHGKHGIDENFVSLVYSVFVKKKTLRLSVSAFGKKQNFLAKSIDFQNNYVYLQPCNYDG